MYFAPGFVTFKVLPCQYMCEFPEVEAPLCSTWHAALHQATTAPAASTPLPGPPSCPVTHILH